MSRLSEQELEELHLQWLGELGWKHVFGPDIEPEKPAAERDEFSTVFLSGRLREALRRLNPGVSQAVLDEAFRIVTRPDSPDLITSNRNFHRMLSDSVRVPYRDADGKDATANVVLVDWESPEENDLIAVNQFTIIERQNIGGDHLPATERNRRPDIILFVNGLPFVVIELKNAADEKATVEAAFNQIQTYKAQITSLFNYNAICVISDGLDARLGTISSDWERFMPWRAIEHPIEGKGDLRTLTFGILQPRRFLDLVRYFLVFEDTKHGPIKKVAGYHQYHAVNTALEAAIRASEEGSDGRGGVVWHTQGSGKSLTMAYFAGRIVLSDEMRNPTIVVVTDRNDLDEQLFNTFASCKDLLRQTPTRAESRPEIRRLLSVPAGGVIFTTIQKFFPTAEEESFPALTDRRNVIVLADEAHRSQYGLEARINQKGEIAEGYAMHMRNALPNATFMAFTGTPIQLTNANTVQVFGDVISVYNVQRAVEDGATVPIYYEGRFAKLSLDEDQRPKIDPEFEEITEGEEETARERLKREWAATEALVGDPKRLNLVADDLVEHWENRVDGMARTGVDGKAMIVCMSRRIAVAMFNALTRLRPEWDAPHDSEGVLKVIMTGAASDPPEFQRHIRSKRSLEDLANRYKDPNDPFKLVIVCDMWLTGFDAPCMHTMYLDKPMKGHNLMQAIARVNRVFQNKPGGLIVDYLGLGEPLKKALAEYAQASGGDKEDAAQTQAKAIKAFFEKLDTCRGLLHGFTYDDWMTGTPQDRLELLADAVDLVLGFDDEKQKRFSARVYELGQAYALSVPDEKVMEHKLEVAFFQSIRAAYQKEINVPKPGQARTNADRELAVKQLVSKAILPGGVVDLFQAAGIEKPNIALLSDEFLNDLKNLPRKNLALELLKRLLNEEIALKSEKNVVKARTFAEMLEEAVKRYTNQAIEMAQLIEELVQMAKDFRDQRNQGSRLGLNEDEESFYDALATNNNAVEVMGDQKLALIARELLSTVRQNATIDWHVRDSVRANLRRLIKRILRKYGYPPDFENAAVQFVIEQAEVICKGI
ncbi:MAG: type I restriction endonuclease subunit R [Armatimonadetes bacterium]|nr:type I restriction endonuclease subunit R [Armatimonadota bacterium]